MPNSPGALSGKTESGIPLYAAILRPSLRQKIWQDALQTARLEGAGTSRVLYWFEYLCRLYGENKTTITPEGSVEDPMQRFVNEWCETGPTLQVRAGPIYEAFSLWHSQTYGSKSSIPSLKRLSEWLRVRFKREEGRHTWFHGITLKGERK